ncbi:MAG: LLM class F420-dependent oxidoreductase [Streptosporangiales bacterium]|nr:LLM class F420-dependent oxidoreductase [Streptosporangiales bacterium]
MGLGLSIPLPGLPLPAHRDVVAALPDLGYTDVWSSEADGADGFTPLALASAWAPQLRLGTAIIPVYTRGAAVLAQSAATLAEAAPGRFAFGIGVSSQVIVEDWNGMRQDRPYARARDTIRFLRAAFAGEKVSQEYETFAVRNFRLGVVPEQPPPILLAGLREGMLRLAGREADGAILNWLSPDDARKLVPIVDAAGPGKETVARIFVLPVEDREAVRAIATRAIAAYLTVPVYAEFHRWLGRGDALADLWRLWNAGERRQAAAAVPDSVIDELIVHGSPEACRERVLQFADAGVTTPMMMMLPGPYDVAEAVRRLAPR